jgi:hypothetical protein
MATTATTAETTNPQKTPEVPEALMRVSTTLVAFAAPVRGCMAARKSPGAQVGWGGIYFYGLLANHLDLGKQQKSCEELKGKFLQSSEIADWRWVRSWGNG